MRSSEKSRRRLRLLRRSPAPSPRYPPPRSSPAEPHGLTAGQARRGGDVQGRDHPAPRPPLRPEDAPCLPERVHVPARSLRSSMCSVVRYPELAGRGSATKSSACGLRDAAVVDSIEVPRRVSGYTARESRERKPGFSDRSRKLTNGRSDRLEVL